MTVGMTTTSVKETTPRLLVFFSKEATPDAIEEGLATIRGASRVNVELTDSLSWYEERFAACGNWESWALEAVTGRSYRPRRPHFTGFALVGSPAIGQGTARTLSLALSIGKPVYWLDGEKLRVVSRVLSSDDGWHISTGGQKR